MNAEECVDLFVKRFNRIIRKCFKKVRITQKKDEALEEMFKLRDNMKKELIQQFDKETNDKLTEIECDIQQHCATENSQSIKNQVQGLCNFSGGFSANGLWKIKNKVISKQKDPPMAKKDSTGNLVTAPTQLKKLYKEEYVHRLRHREINTDLKLLKNLKDDLWERRFDIL